MEEDDTATDMDEEYKDGKDEDEEVIAGPEEVEPGGWVKHMKAASIVWGAFL